MDLEPVFKALADPTRMAIVQQLANGEATVGELAAPFDVTQPAISHHLKVLGQAGLVVMTRDGRLTRCRLEPRALRAVGTWAHDIECFWTDRVGALQRLLTAPTAAPTPSRGGDT